MEDHVTMSIGIKVGHMYTFVKVIGTDSLASYSLKGESFAHLKQITDQLLVKLGLTLNNFTQNNLIV
jgi:hypothetical protein